LYEAARAGHATLSAIRRSYAQETPLLAAKFQYCIRVLFHSMKSKFFVLSGLAFALAGCANLPSTPASAPVATTTPAPTPAGPGAGATTAASAAPSSPTGASGPSVAARPAATPGTPPPPRPFAEVIKGAKETKGWFTTYEKDDKLWLEVMPEQFDAPVALTMNMTHGIGERGLYGNFMGGYGAAGRDLRIVKLQKFNPTTVQLIAVNANIGPRDPKRPVSAAVERAFSDSLLGAAPIASAPHPERKSVLVELNPLLLSDMAHISFQLERSFKQSYAFDLRNSSFVKIRNTEDQLAINTKLHYGLARLSVPTPGGPPGVQPPSVPTMLPDVRSLFMGVQYNFAKLPAEPMPPRIADPRVGYFNTAVYDYGNHDKRLPKERYINRWRLEKKDPSAALSEPKQPITFWLDKNIPEKYRPAITAGIVEWNKAFEKIGFKDAVVVKQQAANDEFDTSELRYASVKWFVSKDAPFGARGPSVVDPRSGEILDADIELSEQMTRFYSTRFAEDTPRPIGHVHANGKHCVHAQMKSNEIAFGMELLYSRGDLAPGSPQAEQFVYDGIRDIMAHEVGHTLGLRHNFRASTIYTEAQVTDPEFTKANGVSGSVMDYNPMNVSLPGQRQGTYFMNTLGPYDYWAIEYGYKPLPRATENEELRKISARSNEPLLAYATDEDAGGWPGVEGIDPEANRFDLTGDPLGHYAKRVKLVRELWDKLQARQLPAGEPYEQLRRNFDRGFANFAIVSELTAKYVGGMSILRDHAGSGRLPINPVTVEKQRAALSLIADNLFSEDNFKFSAQFLNRLSVDFLQREDDVFDEFHSIAVASPSLSLPDRIVKLQRDVFLKLVSDGVSKRLVDSQALANSTAQPLTVSELYGTLQSRIWSELDSGGVITAGRRALQREHLRWNVWTLKRETGNTPGDARVIVRAQAKQLLAKLDGARRSAGMTPENRAHLEDAYDQLNSALNAISQRAGA
jgi:hypothetical protein